VRIVVADDDPSIRSLLATQFEVDGNDVQTVADGRAALAAIEAELPDAVVLDVMMPELSGWDVLEQLRADPRFASLPVVLLSARDLPSDVQHGRSLGASAVLPKPYDPEHLLGILHTLTRRT
jgi:DNA-binding response OmpR family regulator